MLREEDRLLGAPHNRGVAPPDIYPFFQILQLLKHTKQCKDALEVELLHPFDLKPTEEMEVGVNQTTPIGSDTTRPSKLNAPKSLRHAYATNGFVGRHEHDYVATGVDGGNPRHLADGPQRAVLRRVRPVQDDQGRAEGRKASEKNLKSKGFVPIHDTSLGPDEKVFQHKHSGSPLLSTIIYVQRGTFILKIAGSCKGCQLGSIEPSLKSRAQVQLAQAVSNGFPPPLANRGLLPSVSTSAARAGRVSSTTASASTSRGLPARPAMCSSHLAMPPPGATPTR